MGTRSPRAQLIIALGVSTLVSAGLLVVGAIRSHSFGYGYLLWNLFLAWLPLVFALRLVRVIQAKLWSSWEALGMSLLWILFLPNSFYLISDFIHLQDLQQDVLFDAVMLTSFVYTGVIIGFISLYLIHMQLIQRISKRYARLVIGMTLLLCSVGIYLGRDLRWNSWDILTNPGGLLFDVSDRLLHPSAYPEMLLTIGTFFVLLASMYHLLWRGAMVIEATRS